MERNEAFEAFLEKKRQQNGELYARLLERICSNRDMMKEFVMKMDQQANKL